MDEKEIILWQFENIKDIYQSSFQRLVTIFTLINSGGILSIVTLLSSETKNKNIHAQTIFSLSFYPAKWALIFFLIALVLGFILLFCDFSYLKSEFLKAINEISKKGTISTNPSWKSWDILLWILGIVAIFFMLSGLILSLIIILSVIK